MVTILTIQLYFLIYYRTLLRHSVPSNYALKIINNVRLVKQYFYWSYLNYFLKLQIITSSGARASRSPSWLAIQQN